MAGLKEFGAGPRVVDEVVRVEEEVQVLGRLRQEEGLHPVLQLVRPDVLDGGVAALRPRRVLDAPEHVFAQGQEERVFGRTVQVPEGKRKKKLLI